jgi:hypothetical protein
MRRWNIFSITSILALAWVIVAALVMLFTNSAPGALVMFPSQRFIHNLPADAAITAGNAFSVTLSGTEPDLARRLYRSGAWLVLPAGLTGCLKPPSAFTKS